MSALDIFNCTYRDSIELLLTREHTGFPVMMIALPLLERYLREKSGLAEATNLNDDFRRELISLFPELKDNPTATNFWHVFRHGFLHQATFKYREQDGTAYIGQLSRSPKPLAYDGKNVFDVNPELFARKVLEVIASDFATFVGSRSPKHHFPAQISGGTTLTDALSMVPLD